MSGPAIVQKNALYRRERDFRVRIWLTVLPEGNCTATFGISSELRAHRQLRLESRQGNMIARTWHGYTTLENADFYEAMLTPELLPGISKMPGLVGSYLLRRRSGDEVEFITVIFWESYDALRAIAGENYETAIVPEERRKYLKRYDGRALHYEVSSVQSLSGKAPQ